jgi:ABC-type amino acid transport system permease subunit
MAGARLWPLRLLTYVYVTWSLLPIAVMARLSVSIVSRCPQGSPPGGTPSPGVIRCYAKRPCTACGWPCLRLSSHSRSGSDSRWEQFAPGADAAIIRLLGVGPSALPETILASMLFSVVVHLFTVVPLGTGAQLLGHVTLALPYVTVVVSAALLSLDPACEEAAVDLGASTLGVLRYVVLPLLAPALLAVAMMCFTISLNDFVMSHFLCIDTDCATVPMLLYSRAPSVPDPTESAVAISQILFAMMTLGMALFLRRRFVARSSAHSQPRTGADVSHRRLRRFS